MVNFNFSVHQESSAMPVLLNLSEAFHALHMTHHRNDLSCNELFLTITSSVSSPTV